MVMNMKLVRFSFQQVILYVMIICIIMDTPALATGRIIQHKSGSNVAENHPIWEIMHHGFESDDAIMSDIAFFNDTHGWVVGQNESGLGNGIILHTIDGGKTWNQQLANASQEFSSIEIINESNIIVSCWYGFVHSYDGGQTWHYKAVIPERAPFGDVAFINATHGWSGALGDLYFTVDGGQTWTNASSWCYRDIPRGIQIVSDDEIRIIGIEGIYRTVDGGVTWNQEFQDGGWDIVPAGALESWAVSDSMLLHSTNGEAWEVEPNPRPARHDPSRPPYFTDIFFIDENHGWLVGKETPVAYTPDGGRNWYSQDVPEEMDKRVIAVDFYNETLGWATCWGDIIMKTEKGNTIGALLPQDKPISIIPVVGFGAIAAVMGLAVFIFRKRRNTRAIQ